VTTLALVLIFVHWRILWVVLYFVNAENVMQEVEGGAERMNKTAVERIVRKVDICKESLENRVNRNRTHFKR
jgi:hypothetical protein